MDYRAKPFYLNDEDIKWVEETFAGMSLDDKINQVLIDMLWKENPKKLAETVKNRCLGGYRYNNQSKEKLLEQNATIQRNSKIPALIAANVEGGGNGAMSGGTKIGDGIAIAATQKEENAYYLGYYGCKEAAAVGCNWTFAPVVDIDFNWRNCVIPTRCFGNDTDRVLKMSLEYMRGAHEAGLATCMKHFPGDGLDERDQHLVTTVNTQTIEEWDNSFGKVYQGMIDAGVPSVMIGHITLPSYTKHFNPDILDKDIMPATVSKELLQDLLRNKLGFNGLIVTDATHMVGITSFEKRRDFLPKMLMSGCDMILYFRDYDEDFSYLKEALAKGTLTLERLNEAVKTVLAFKAYLKLHIKQKEGTLIPKEEGLSVVGCKEHKDKAKQIIDESITLVKNTKNQIPLDPKVHKKIIIYPIEEKSFISKIIGLMHNTAKCLKEELEKEGFEVEIFKLKLLKLLKPKNGKRMLQGMSIQEFNDTYDAAILLANVASFSTTNERALHWKVPMGPEIPWYVTEVPTIGISTAHPFHLIDVPMISAYINTYNNSKEAMRQVVQKIVGKSEFKGVSPVDASCGRKDTMY